MVKQGSESLKLPGYLSVFTALTVVGAWALYLALRKPIGQTNDIEEIVSDTNGPTINQEQNHAGTTNDERVAISSISKETLSLVSAKDSLDSEMSTTQLAWSFFAVSTGAWILYSPAMFASRTGVYGISSYTISAALPMFVLCFIGPLIQSRYDSINSTSEFLETRYSNVSGGGAANISPNKNTNTNTDTVVASITADSDQDTEAEIVGLAQTNTKLSSKHTISFSAHGILYILNIIQFLNVFICLISEYTVVGDVVSEILGINRIVIITVLGIFSILYTIFGGIRVSLRMDVIQGVCAVVLVMLVGIFSLYYYIQIPSKLDLGWISSIDNIGETLSDIPQKINSLWTNSNVSNISNVAAVNNLGDITSISTSTSTSTLGAEYDKQEGLNSLFIFPISLSCSALLNELIWQRSWGAKSQSSLRIASLISGGCIMVVCFIYAFIGYLGAQHGSDFTQQTLAAFSYISIGINNTGAAAWIWVLLTTLATVITQSTLDSYQNGFFSIFATSHFTKQIQKAWNNRRRRGNVVNQDLFDGGLLDNEVHHFHDYDYENSKNLDMHSYNTLFVVNDASRSTHNSINTDVSSITASTTTTPFSPTPSSPSSEITDSPSAITLRIAVFSANALAMSLSLFNLNIISLFLLANMLSICLAPAIILGVIPIFDKYYTAFWAFISPIMSLAALIAYGYVETPAPHRWFLLRIIDGITFAFYENFTLYPVSICLGTTFGISLLGIAINKVREMIK